MKNSKIVILVSVIYLFVFQKFIQQYISVFQYWDEFYGLLFFPLLIINSPVRFKKTTCKYIIRFILFVFLGIISNVVFKYQCIQAIFLDILLNIKFFLGIGTTYLLSKEIKKNKVAFLLKRHIKVITILLMIVFVIDKFFGVFPVYEVRYGIKSTQLFFEHPTELAAVSFFLLLLLGLISENYKGDKFFVICLLIIEISTLRVKALACTAVYFFLYYFVLIKKEKISLKHIIYISPAIILIGIEQFSFYFLSDTSSEMARGALLFKSFEIARDHFPLGTGFGTYASAPSKDFYSIIYNKYSLSGIWGLSKTYGYYISDSFWPMIIGQFGYLGLLVYLTILYSLFKHIQLTYKVDKNIYFSMMGALVYLLISSLAESAFVNPFALLFSVIIGLGFALSENSLQ